MPCQPDHPCVAEIRNARFPILAVAFIACAALIGCSQPASAPPTAMKTGNATASHDHDDHDHDDGHDHEHPTTLAGAVEAIGSRLVSLEKAFAKDDHDEADSLVHEVGHLLEDGEELLAKVPEAVAAKARDAWKEVEDCLADVDEKLHDAGDDKAAVKKAYEAVKDRISTAIEALRGHVKSTAEPAGK